jgi:predicted nucleic acid-binding protein
VRAFFDTNVLVYSFLDLEKRERALDTLSMGGIISVQVLNEFTHVAHKKRRRPWPDIETAISVIRMQFPEILSITPGTHLSALIIARDHSFSFYDALIVASALEAGCDPLYSEDLQDGRSISGLTIVNPFARQTP